MPDMVREAIDRKHLLRDKPFAVWVGGPHDGEAKDLALEILKHGHLHDSEYIRVGKDFKPAKFIYPIREVYDSLGKRGWRIFFLERYQTQ